MSTNDMIAVSPRHFVKLAEEYTHLLSHPPGRDFVIRTLAHKEASGTPIMMAELVIASAETRARFPLADTYPLHFRKTYFPGSFHGDPAQEYAQQARAHELIGVPPPIGHTADSFRSCFLPGKPYSRLTPFGIEPEDQNIAIARDLDLARAAGLWFLMEQAFARFQMLHSGGFAHGDAELHNLIVCPAPLDLLLIDFEAAHLRADEDAPAWARRCAADLTQILREAIFLQCALGSQPGPFAERAWADLDRLFTAPDRFRRAIQRQAAL